jgi:hypothetical protein
MSASFTGDGWQVPDSKRSRIASQFVRKKRVPRADLLSARRSTWR